MVCVTVKRYNTQNLSAKLPNCTWDLSISTPKLAEREKDNPPWQGLANTDWLSLIPLPLYKPTEHRADTGVGKVPEEKHHQKHHILSTPSTTTSLKISNLK